MRERFHAGFEGRQLLLRHSRRRFGGGCGFHFWAIEMQHAVVLVFARGAGERLAGVDFGVVDAQRIDGVAGELFKIRHARAVQRQAIAFHDQIILNERRAIEERFGFAARGEVVAKAGFGEAVRRDEAIAVEAESEADVELEETSAEAETFARMEMAGPRERRPADVAVAFAPAYPCRRPDAIRRPHPAVAVAVFPAAIVKWRPAP